MDIFCGVSTDSTLTKPGTMAGVRGFKDPNVQFNDNGKSVWYQNVNASMSLETDYLLPFYLNHLGGHWEEATQCLEAGSNGKEFNARL